MYINQQVRCQLPIECFIVYDVQMFKTEDQLVIIILPLSSLHWWLLSSIKLIKNHSQLNDLISQIVGEKQNLHSLTIEEHL